MTDFEKVQNDHTIVTENDGFGILKSLQTSPSKMSGDSANDSDDNLQLKGDQESEDDAPKQRVKRRIQQFSDSDSEREVTQNVNNTKKSQETLLSEDSVNNVVGSIGILQKSRIRRAGSSNSDSPNSGHNESGSKDKSQPLHSDSDSNTTITKRIRLKHRQHKLSNESSDSDQAVGYGQQMRMKNKRDKMKNKFKSLISSREKDQSTVNAEIKSIKSNSDSEDNEEASSIEKIKQKIKEKMSYKPSICDPDTSDEEAESIKHNKSMPKQKKERRIELTSPKPQRMSAKQAMENMQKIRSESNRMLREKEVSLPYHRPKALSLKDIMSRRKPAVSSDGKCLPVKMNGEQLKQYAKMLEDRQKQMMELWQSDTEEEEEDKKSDDEITSEKVTEDDKKHEETSVYNEKQVESLVPLSENDKEVNNISANNDKLFDVLSQSIIEEETKENESNQKVAVNEDSYIEDQDSASNIKLVFNDSEISVAEEKHDTEISLSKLAGEIEENNETVKDNEGLETTKPNTESDSQLVSLHYDSEKNYTDIVQETNQSEQVSPQKPVETEKTGDEIENNEETEAMDVDGFSDEDMNIEDIDNIIENAEIIRDFEDKVNSQVLIRDRPLNLNPKLMGAPGMVIDLDDSDIPPKKSGVELLKERFTFFANLKTPEELERENERKIKPGNQHLKLKQELEEQMAEQRSLEWAKRLEDEKQPQKEMIELRGEDSDDENDIDKIEAKLEEDVIQNKIRKSTQEEPDQSESEGEEELLENDIDMKDKPLAKNPMLDNEAEESDCDESENADLQNEDENEQENAEINDGDDEDADSSDDSESSESEEEQTTTKKGRILKAFEDSDDEDVITESKGEAESGSDDDAQHGGQVASQDDVLTLAQRHKSASEDLFTSQGSSLMPSQKVLSQIMPESQNDVDLGTQTFSILDSTNNATIELLNASGMGSAEKLNICETQPYDNNLDAVAICSGTFSQNLPPLPITQVSQSQTIGENILALCTGKFYENEFISQVVENQTQLGASQQYDSMDDDSQTDIDKPPGNELVDTDENNKVIVIEEKNTELAIGENGNTELGEIQKVDDVISNKETEEPTKQVIDENLKSILDELDDPEFDTPKPNKFFCGKTQKETDSKKEQEVIKKKLVIDSDDDVVANESETKKRKKLKKRKPEMRALQISDDEEEEVSGEEYESEIEEDIEERLVEYDSEENEIEVKPLNQKPSKKKRKGTEFFEQEAELTSEDEWLGSGDEDEAGLDRMEREEGDDESFHQGRLQRELGQIHLREVIDQDKREVRIIQELLFEDGDLGAGGRHRKFKWKNLDDDDEMGTGSDEFKDTQEEEFESEEQWRKQRHERETFLRQMQNNGELDDSLNVSINRTTIIKANLMSKSVSMLLSENQPAPAKNENSTIETEKKKDIPSPKKPFSILQQNYQGSILNRGRGALARLAALATPLAVDDDDAPRGKSAATSSRRNFVFATLTPEAPKVTKRKAELNPGTPALVKKMKTEEKHIMSKSRLLDHMKL